MKFNQQATPNKAINEKGGYAYVMPPKENLVSSVLTTFLNGGFYETPTEEVEKIRNAADKCDPEFVAKTAIYARTQGKLRSSTHLLASHIAPRVAGEKWGRNFYRKIVFRPDDIYEILACYNTEYGKKMSHAMKNGFKEAFEHFDPYQLDKYKAIGKDWNILDAINVLHPNTKGKTAEAVGKLLKGESISDLYDSKILEKEMTKAGTKKGDKTQNQKEAIESVLKNVKGMPIMNLVRNLRNILKYAPESVGDAIAELNNYERVKNSKLLPFRFATAYEEIDKLDCNDTTNTSIAFESDKQYSLSEREFNEKKEALKTALQTALEYSCDNIPVFEGNTAILVDHSGSVRSENWRVGTLGSKLSMFSSVTTAKIGNLFGALLAHTNKDVYLADFGDGLVTVPIDRNEGVLDYAARAWEAGKELTSDTEPGLQKFFRLAIKEHKKIDNLVIFSDMVIGGSNWGKFSNSTEVLLKELKKLNPQMHTVCVDLRSTGGKSTFHYETGVLEIAGWSEHIFDIIEKETKGYKALIEEIEKIEL